MSVLRGIVTLSVTLATATALAVVAGPPATAAGPAEYAFQTEWQTATDFDQRPIDVAVAPNGRIHVLSEGSDWNAQDKTRVQVYDAAGTLLQTWADIPNHHPWGIAIGPDGLVHVTDRLGAQFLDVPPNVRVYTASGGFVRQYGLAGDANVWSAGGVAVAADGTSYLTDPAYGRIHKFAADGAHVASFGTPGGAVGQFNGPLDIDIAPGGNLVVADTDNARVQVLDPGTGAVVRHWGQLGTGPGQFHQKVNTVEVRADGHVYVGDDSDQLKVFTLTGQPVGVVRTGSVLAGAPNFAIKAPTGIAFGAGQAMYVSGSFSYTKYGVARYLPAVPKGTAPKTKAGTGKAKVAKGTVRLRKKRLRLRIDCAKTARCTGKVRVTVNGKAITKPKRYAIKPGKKKRITVKVTKKGLKQLRRTKVTRAVAVTNGGKKTRTKIKIRR